MKALIRPFIYIVSALMALSFASCNDFLDKEPEGKVPEEKVDYTDISNMYQPYRRQRQMCIRDRDAILQYHQNRQCSHRIIGPIRREYHQRQRYEEL